MGCCAWLVPSSNRSLNRPISRRMAMLGPS